MYASGGLEWCRNSIGYIIKGKYGLITDGINRVNWELEFENKLEQECWEIFKVKLEELVEEHVPMSNPKDYNEPWMNRVLMK